MVTETSFSDVPLPTESLRELFASLPVCTKLFFNASSVSVSKLFSSKGESPVFRFNNVDN